MMNHTTEIDTIKLQVEFLNGDDQRAVLNGIVYALLSTYSQLHIKYNTGSNKGLQVHIIYTAGTKILELKTGSFLSGSYQDKKRLSIYYVSVEIAGLKKYNIQRDKISQDCLLRVCAYLNTNMIRFEITEIDLCVDMLCPYENTYAFCNKKAAGVKYYKVDEPQDNATTHYVEKYNHTHNRVMKRAYLYDKRIKEGTINFTITRFELKLQSRYFGAYEFGSTTLSENLEKYHVLFFPTQEEKRAALSLYKKHEGNIRRRDLHRLGLDYYRVYPDTGAIEFFLFSLYAVYEHHLNFPSNSMVDNGFDF
jgi:hypothetical protein